MKIQRTKVTDLTKLVVGPIDMFICSSSYEDRCYSIAGALRPQSVRASFIAQATDLIGYVKRNSASLTAHLGHGATLVPISTHDPLQTADSLINIVQATKADGVKSVLIDTTTFTHEALLILLRLLRTKLSKRQGAKIILAYTGAQEYSVGDAIASKWLSKGVREVRTVLGYPGKNLPSRKTHLIVLVGYEHERAARLIEILEPNSISLGFGKPSTATTDRNKDANEHFHKLVWRMAASYTNVESFEIYCNNPVRTRDAVLSIARRLGGKNVLLAPMNNKMSTLGAALAAFDCEKIQICYAPVLEYNYSGYSSAGSECYLIRLPELFSGPKT